MKRSKWNARMGVSVWGRVDRKMKCSYIHLPPWVDILVSGVPYGSWRRAGCALFSFSCAGIGTVGKEERVREGKVGKLFICLVGRIWVPLPGFSVLVGGTSMPEKRADCDKCVWPWYTMGALITMGCME